MDKAYQSEQINELVTALAKAQGGIKHATKDVSNTFFKSKYAALDSVYDAARTPLSDNGLSVVQVTDIDDKGEVVLMSQLSHSSGQWMRSWYPIRPVKNDPQGLGSAITYARRYAYCSIVGVAAGDDDDGNHASGNPDAPAKPIFKNAAARNKWCKDIIETLEKSQFKQDVYEIMLEHKARLDEVSSTNQEFDVLAVESIKSNAQIIMKRLPNRPPVEGSQADISAMRGMPPEDDDPNWVTEDPIEESELPVVRNNAAAQTSAMPKFLGRGAA